MWHLNIFHLKRTLEMFHRTISFLQAAELLAARIPFKHQLYPLETDENMKPKSSDGWFRCSFHNLGFSPSFVRGPVFFLPFPPLTEVPTDHQSVRRFQSKAKAVLLSGLFLARRSIGFFLAEATRIMWEMLGWVLLFDHVYVQLSFSLAADPAFPEPPRNTREQFGGFGDCFGDIVKLSAGFCQVCPKNNAL